MSSETGRRMGVAEYAELVTRVHAAVAATLPPGAGVLVLSRGDHALVEIPGFVASHFPQDSSGEYAGHHPRDSEDAIAQLEALRRHGAGYLVIPATARWWMDHYAGFAEHLASEGAIVADEAGTCLIFDLSRRTAAEGVGTTQDAAPQTSIAQMRDYLEYLLPTDTRVLVLEAVEGVAAALAPVQALALSPHELHGDGEGPIAALGRLADGGAEYLVVPRDADEWLERNTDVGARIEAGARKIADQRHLCRVFELKRILVPA
jgi:hypothetical protein